MSVKSIAYMIVSRLNTLEHFMNYQDLFNAKMNTTIRTNCVNSIVLVYTNG